MMVLGRVPVLNPFIDSTITTLGKPAKLGMLRPALAPLVPWQPAQAFDNMAAVGGTALAMDETAIAPTANARLLHLTVILIPPLVIAT
jgi:hypothetical protein